MGIADAQGMPPTVSPGTDLAAGLVTLVSAAVILVLVVMSRLVGAGARRILASFVILLGAVSTLVAAWFIKAAPDYYSPVDEVAARCTEVESGARNVDNILTNTLLPELSRRVLEWTSVLARPGPVKSVADLLH